MIVPQLCSLMRSAGGHLDLCDMYAATSNKEFDVPSCPSDDLSSLCFSSKAWLCATSWDCTVSLWEVTSQQAAPKAQYRHEKPAVCSVFTPDGSKVISAGFDNKALMHDLQTGGQQQVAQHSAGIRCIKMFNDILITGGLDNCIKYWDCRQPNPVGQVQCPGKVFAIDVCQNLMVAGLSNLKVALFDLNQPNQPQDTLPVDPIRHQIRSVGIVRPDPRSYVVGSVEGRCIIKYVSPSFGEQFSFKCQRTSTTAYPVTQIECHPMGTIATIGGEAGIHVWDPVFR